MAAKKDGEYEIRFWKDWLKADSLKRHDLVKKLPLFKMCLNMRDDELSKNSFATIVNSYFEDLESAVYTKIRIEKNQKNKLHTPKKGETLKNIL